MPTERLDAQQSVAKILSLLAPQAGLEPASLRLTGGKRNVSHPLRTFAGRCRIAPHSSYFLPIFGLRLVPALAVVCRSLVHRKGKKRATSRRRISAQMRPSKFWRRTSSRIPAELQTRWSICGSQVNVVGRRTIFVRARFALRGWFAVGMLTRRAARRPIRWIGFACRNSGRPFSNESNALLVAARPRSLTSFPLRFSDWNTRAFGCVKTF